MNASDGSRLEKLIDGQQTENLEELHLLTPGLSWSPDGKRLALAAKAGEEDAILLFDVDDLDNEKLTFGLEGIFSVAWSPGGDKLAFVGNDHKQSDIYVYDMASQELINLTSDVFSDSEPAWSPDGTRIVFASDRGAMQGDDGSIAMDSVDYQQKDLYLVDAASREVTRLTDWPESDETSPVVGPDGNSLLFISDRNGINNIYTIALDTREWRPVTNSIAGVYQLSLSRDGSKMAFTSLSHSGFDIFVMRSPLQRDPGVEELEFTEFFKLKHTQAPPPKAAATLAADAVKEDTSRAGEGLYGDNIEIDFSNYVFQETHNETVPTDSTIQRMPQISGNVDDEGKYKVNKYKLNFSPDIVYGAAGYDTFYGISGSTVMAFSDMLGDHQIVFVTNLLLDLKNSDYGLQYFYLGGRIDWGVGGFHSARFVFLRDVFGESLYRFRTYGASISAYYPIDRFTRFEYDLTWYSVTKENLDRIQAPIQQRNLLVPGFGYVYDTVLWGFASPVTGSRYRFSVFGTPKLGRDGISFVNVTGDYRTYLRLGKFYSFALRLAGGGSFGTDPQKFVVGGVDYWINPSFEGGYIPLENAEDYLFLQTGLPLRGYNYNARIGSRYFIYNMELRYPLFAFLQAGPLPIGLQSLGGAIFFDMGSAWNPEEGFVPFTRNAAGKTVTRDLLMGMGTGARIYFLVFLVRLDVAWAYNLDRWSTPKYYFSLGADF
jgi:hypothetical protein